MKKQSLIVLMIGITVHSLFAQNDNEYPEEGDVKIYQAFSGYRIYDVINRNGLTVSRFEATTDASGQMWLKNAVGNYKIALRTNSQPSSIGGEVIVGSYTNVTRGRTFSVDGTSQFNNHVFSKNAIRFKNNTDMKGMIWGNIEWNNYNTRIDDYNGQLHVMSDDNIYFTDIYSTTGLPGTVAMYINTNDAAVGIGTTNLRSDKLAVNGTIRSKEIKVEAAPWPDYVFASDYDLKSLAETKGYIDEHSHLPGMPSAKEVEENGIALGEMNAKLLEKIEELTLLLIQQNEQLQDQQKRLETLEKVVNNNR